MLFHADISIFILHVSFTVNPSKEDTRIFERCILTGRIFSFWNPAESLCKRLFQLELWHSAMQFAGIIPQRRTWRSFQCCSWKTSEHNIDLEKVGAWRQRTRWTHKRISLRIRSEVLRRSGEYSAVRVARWHHQMAHLPKNEFVQPTF